MRTFRFMTGETTEEQQQTISCDLHLEASEDIQEEQAADCTCHTEQECAELDGKFTSPVTLLLTKPLVENCFSMWRRCRDDVETMSVAMSYGHTLFFRSSIIISF